MQPFPFSSVPEDPGSNTSKLLAITDQIRQRTFSEKRQRSKLHVSKRTDRREEQAAFDESRFPGTLALLVVLLCVVPDTVILYKSNEKQVETLAVSPSVYLAISSAVQMFTSSSLALKELSLQ
jgi:hypothetical protein